MKRSASLDILVIGGGHAGIEAAWAAQQFDLKVGIATLPGLPMASTPCNPAIGGVGKGQVVREIDALGGLMGRLADLAAIQYRTLNQSKGHALHSTRVQVDKEHYAKTAEQIIESSPIAVIRKEVVSIACNKQGFTAHFTDASSMEAKKLIVTAGTFLGGVLHIGSEQIRGGRLNGKTSSIASKTDLRGLLQRVQGLPARFKTGTPARLFTDSID